MGYPIPPIVDTLDPTKSYRVKFETYGCTYPPWTVAAAGTQRWSGATIIGWYEDGFIGKCFWDPWYPYIGGIRFVVLSITEV